MPTPRFSIPSEGFDPAALAEPARILAEGGLVGFPTETVYGIAARADHPEAIERLTALKTRPPEKPYSVHISDVEQLSSVVGEIPPAAHPLIDQFWPGPLTIVFPIEGAAARGTVGVRLPAHEVARELIRQSGVPIVAPSANPEGSPPAIDADEVVAFFDGKLDAIIDSGPVKIREASTVVEVHPEGDYEILRAGIVTERAIRRAVHGRRILFVCTGNTCRSPMAMTLARGLLAEKLGVPITELHKHGYSIHSAGIAGFGGGRASTHAVEVMEERGFVSLEEHRSRAVSREMLHAADLIIALGHGHRDSILQFEPGLIDRVHVISETGVSDPIGGDRETYRRTALEIERELASRWLKILEEL